ncbi:LysR substrate-binding domain-containing protein [Archangium primigenium]|uniref:LysR substrate-binding domain-containing protein n=1 Tax=[Archangium] primigenium TaxID=2792470 RepID=UPI00195C2C56|nr:LysR substrate-binding domain-containing protein [Archangium primigenium]MBM7116548.1 LysR family transcriptional regulator [Archangium primigenium]
MSPTREALSRALTDLTDLRLFLAVAETGSITRGARRVHLSLAAASERIHRLEDGWGVALLERRGRGVRLTSAGEALVPEARAVLLQVEHLQGAIALHAQGLRGRVRLLCNTAALSGALPEALGAFLAQHPLVDVELEERPSPDIVQAVAEGRVEVGLVADTVDLGGLETFAFQEDRLAVVMAPGHRLAMRRAVAFAEVLDEPLVGLAEGSALQEMLEAQALRLGRPPRYRLRPRGVEEVCRVVALGGGVGVVPGAAARRWRRPLGLRAVPLEDVWARRQLTLCVRRLDGLSPFARLLVDGLRRSPLAG